MTVCCYHCYCEAAFFVTVNIRRGPASLVSTRKAASLTLWQLGRVLWSTTQGSCWQVLSIYVSHKWLSISTYLYVSMYLLNGLVSLRIYVSHTYTHISRHTVSSTTSTRAGSGGVFSRRSHYHVLWSTMAHRCAVLSFLFQNNKMKYSSHRALKHRSATLTGAGC